jgi:hypothetical protein
MTAMLGVGKVNVLVDVRDAELSSVTVRVDDVEIVEVNVRVSREFDMGRVNDALPIVTEVVSVYDTDAASGDSDAEIDQVGVLTGVRLVDPMIVRDRVEEDERVLAGSEADVLTVRTTEGLVEEDFNVCVGMAVTDVVIVAEAPSRVSETEKLSASKLRIGASECDADTNDTV